MTSRERVIKSINHQPIDRMPIDLGMHNSTGISAFAYWNLREHLGLSTDDIKIPDMVQFLARVDDDILQRFHCDCMMLQAPWSHEAKWNPRGNYKFNIPSTAQPMLRSDGSWIVEKSGQTMRMPKDGFFFDGGWPGFSDLDETAQFQATVASAERIFKETDYFTTYIGYHAYFCCDNMDWQCNMIVDPDLIRAENDRIHEAQIASVSQVIDQMGGYVQAVALNSDLGSQRGPLVNPALYQDLCAPYVKKFCDFVHQNSDMKTFLHCCGSMKPLIPTLIDCGIDIINPVQISADNMNPADLKHEFGKDITFWGGGCDTQNVLSTGSVDEVKQNVKDLVSVFKPDGGFVFNQVHNIMGNVPPENIVAMLDTAYEESFEELD